MCYISDICGALGQKSIFGMKSLMESLLFLFFYIWHITSYSVYSWIYIGKGISILNRSKNSIAASQQS